MNAAEIKQHEKNIQINRETTHLGKTISRIRVGKGARGIRFSTRRDDGMLLWHSSLTAALDFITAEHAMASK